MLALAILIYNFTIKIFNRLNCFIVSLFQTELEVIKTIALHELCVLLASDKALRQPLESR